MNTQILEEIKPILRANRHAFLMGAYVAERDQDEFVAEIREPEKNLCGTACCIAGTIVAHVDKVHLSENGRHIGNRAAEIIECGRRAEDVDLFFIGRWPGQLIMDYYSAKTDSDRVEVACRAIDQFIEKPDAFAYSADDDEDDEYEFDLDDDDGDGEEEDAGED